MSACKDCRFWLPRDTDEFGMCRFNPPTPVFVVHPQAIDGAAGIKGIKTEVISHFPVMHADGWCGKHER